jgi:uncharacterized protein (TIGR02145 family)
MPILFVFVAIAALDFAQRVPEQFRDSRDGRVYATVRLGTREWMTTNLAYASARSACYGDAGEDCGAHGRLYTWDIAREACPVGWRLPTDRDWMDLEEALGMPANVTRQVNARGIDEGIQLQPGGRSGMNVLASGYRRPDGDYVRRGERAAFWTSTEANAADAWHRDVRPGVGSVYRSPVTKTYALSVRCAR